MKISCALPSILFLATTLTACTDSYVPDKDEDPIVIIDEENKATMPTFISAEITLGEISGPLIEGGAPATIEVALKREPTAGVTISLTSSDEAAGEVSPATVEFSVEDWQVPQRITLTPGDDDVAGGDTEWALQFEMMSEDESFAGATVPNFALVTIDNDVAPTLVTSVMGEPLVSEQGDTAAISVQLSRQPAGEVLMQVSVSDTAEASVSSNSLTFDTLTWNLPQQVVVTGLDDMEKDGDMSFDVVFGPANSVDEAFNGIGPFALTLTNTDGVCGNGVVDGAEVCEPDGTVGCPAGEETCMLCTNACELIQTDGSSFCGDGVTQPDNGEECDEVERACTYGEESCETCRACMLIEGQVTGFCGDGQVQGNQGEACDEAKSACDYGQMSCMTCENCQLVAGDVTGFCGDGVVQAEEQCDEDEVGCDYGQMSCMTCRNCQSVEGVLAGYCGDDVVQESEGEACDGDPALQGITCPRRQEGAVCMGDCQLDFASCRNDNMVVSSGIGFSCGLTSAGGVKCWGDNSRGQLGTGNTGGEERAAVDVMSLSTGVRQVAVGGLSACALKYDGALVCWGSGYGATPTAIVQPGSTFTKIAMGLSHGCAYDMSSDVTCWGDDTYSQLGEGVVPGDYSNVVQGLSAGIVDIEAGSVHTCVVYGSARQVECWGGNFDGQLGFSTPGNLSRSAERVQGLSGVQALALGEQHSCAQTFNNGATCWGANDQRQLGDNTNFDSTSPVTVSGLGSVVAISAGYYHTCALTGASQVSCWGDGFGGSKSQIQGISSDVDQLAGGLDHTCVAMATGGVKCFGENDVGQLGHNSMSARSSSAVDVANF